MFVQFQTSKTSFKLRQKVLNLLQTCNPYIGHLFMGRVDKEPVEWQALPALDAETQSDIARDTINPGIREPNFRKLSQRLDKYTKRKICERKVNTATLSLPSLSKNLFSHFSIVNDKGKNFCGVHFTQENIFSGSFSRTHPCWECNVD